MCYNIRNIITVVGLFLTLLAGTANAVSCREVNASFDASSEGSVASAIQNSGWVRLTYGGVVGGKSGWFKFTDNKRVFATHNGAMSGLQWSVSMTTVTSADDCDPVVQAPINQSSNLPWHTEIQTLFVYCAYKTPRVDMTWWDPANTSTSFEIERKSGNSWQSHYVGPSDCIMQDGSLNGIEYRVRGINSYGAGSWVHIFAVGDCVSGHGGPGF